MALLASTFDLLVCPWFKIFENLAIEIMLGTSCMNQRNGRQFRSHGKVFPWYSRPVQLIFTKTAINLAYAYRNLENVNMCSSEDRVCNDQCFWHIEHRILILDYMKSEALVLWQDTELRMIASHCNIVARRCSVTVQGSINILREAPKHVFSANFTAKPVILTEFMIVTFELIASICIRHT